MLVLSTVLITLALVFYTAGVWTERIQGSLTWGHVSLFALGFAADASGTWLMSLIAKSGEPTNLDNNPFLAQAMVVSGALALALMGLHLAWAVVVMIRNKPEEKEVFHKFSLVVWAIWLIPYFTGAAAAML